MTIPKNAAQKVKSERWPKIDIYRTEVVFNTPYNHDFTMTPVQLAHVVEWVYARRNKYPSVQEWQKSLDYWQRPLKRWAANYPQEAIRLNLFSGKSHPSLNAGDRDV